MEKTIKALVDLIRAEGIKVSHYCEGDQNSVCLSAYGICYPYIALCPSQNGFKATGVALENGYRIESIANQRIYYQEEWVDGKFYPLHSGKFQWHLVIAND